MDECVKMLPPRDYKYFLSSRRNVNIDKDKLQL